MNSEELKELVVHALEDLKGVNISVLDVHEKTTVTDWMVVVTGTSNRHVKSLADNLERDVRKTGLQALGVEGQQSGEWVLVDFGDVVVHVMLQAARDFYSLEKLWSVSGPGSEVQPNRRHGNGG